MALGLSLLAATNAYSFDLNKFLNGDIGQAMKKGKEKLQNKESNSSNSPKFSAGNAAMGANCEGYNQWGTPVVTRDAEKITRRAFSLCRINYFSYFDPASKTPLWVGEVVANTQGKEPRTDNFGPDPDVPLRAQASLKDYKGTKFDRGHMAPAADMVGADAMNQSFYLTNMVPQVGPNMNRGVWADLEGMVRKISDKEGPVVVYSGPIFDAAGLGMNQIATIGTSNVWVPTHLYKVIYRPASGQMMSYILPNVQVVTRKTKNLDAGNEQYVQTMPQKAVNCNSSCTTESFKVKIEEVEARTGLTFFPKVPRR